jgi:hypothetical protein
MALFPKFHGKQNFFNVISLEMDMRECETNLTPRRTCLKFWDQEFPELLYMNCWEERGCRICSIWENSLMLATFCDGPCAQCMLRASCWARVPQVEVCVWAKREVPSFCIWHSNTWPCPLWWQHSVRGRIGSGSVSGDGLRCCGMGHCQC